MVKSKRKREQAKLMHDRMRERRLELLKNPEEPSPGPEEKVNINHANVQEEKKGPCLICCCPGGKPLNRNTYLPHKYGVKHPHLVEDDLKILHVLKTVFQIDQRNQLTRLWEVSNGLNPREWIYACLKCQKVVTDTVLAYQRLQTAKRDIERGRAAIFDKIRRSENGDGDLGDMGKTIRGMHRWKPRLSSSVKGNPFNEGDEMAKEMLLSEIKTELDEDNDMNSGTEAPLEEQNEDDRGSWLETHLHPDVIIKEEEEETENNEDPDQFLAPYSEPNSGPAANSGSGCQGNVDANASGGKCRKESSAVKIEVVNVSESEEEVEIESVRTFNEFFKCPLCPQSEGSSEAATTATGMNMAEFIPHLIFHNDNPMKCSQCSIFLPSDPQSLASHWLHFHSTVPINPEEANFFEEKISIEDITSFKLMNPTEEAEDKSAEPLKCNDCDSSSSSSSLSPNFENMNQFKIHQALEHTEVARLSCSLCPKKFPKTVIHNHSKKHSLENKQRNEDTASGRLKLYWESQYKTHLLSDHKISLSKFFWDSHMCQFCGEMIPKSKKALLDIYMDKLHVIARHPKLINASYTCTSTSCSRECSDLQEFLQHASSDIRHCHSKLNLNKTGTLCHLKIDKIECCLCPSSSSSGNFSSYPKFMSHLTMAHSLYVKWEFDPNNPSRREMTVWKPIPEHVEAMKRMYHNHNQAETKTIHVMDKKDVEAAAVATKNLNEYKERNPPKYTCPTCPKFKKMNIDDFIAHVIFHWRRPHKCTKCSLYLPLTSEGIENHWKELHSDDLSSNPPPVKFEMAAYSPGKVFKCRECPQAFASIQNRNGHEHKIHNLSVPKLLQCKECSVGVHNLEELRLHKAISHPAIASVSCSYCDEVFMLESSEGAQYLDYESLEEHIMQRDDHPKHLSQRVAIVGQQQSFDVLLPSPCSYCGKVVPDKAKTCNRVRTHILDDHGIKRTLSFSCHICNSDFAQSLYTHLLKKHAKPGICDTCGEEVKAQVLPEHNLSKHGIVTEGREVLDCGEDGCGYRTYHSYYLKRHKEMHDPNRERSHKCGVCGKAFWDKGHLREHELIHANKKTKPFQCEICGASFALRNYLYIHKRLSHLGKKFPSTNRKRPRKDPSSSTSKKGKPSLPPSPPSSNLEDLRKPS